MTWTIYRVVFRLQSPMHIGCGMVGNMLRTRPYVPGRAIWGALTQRLTRDQAPPGLPAVDSIMYQEIGDQVQTSLVFTYFFPAIRQTGDVYDVVWPWEDNFESQFLSSYATTALAYPEQSAEDGSLHEVEFLSPRRRDTCEPVFLLGYIAENRTLKGWQNTLNRLQFGGERCYGWGRVEVVALKEHDPDQPLFGTDARMLLQNSDRPRIEVMGGKQTLGYLLAHTLPDNGLKAMGTVGPLVGREWRSDDSNSPYAGQYVAYSGFCFQPGSRILETSVFDLIDFGIWKKSA